ncbi:MAG: hypothetical protein KF889_19600 [Alphaproteobacteria bacterium]|nr:hypothetical protein [Alphaproteobacteria bacterium]MCW5744347.1 hypothetical protein [Alphaproteobacteria bacterium]
MLVWLGIGAAAALTIAGLWWLLGGSDDVMARRDLPGFGHVDVPKRLEARAPEAASGFTVFRFDRIAGGFAFMGSITPVRERLVIVAWDRHVGERTAAIAAARRLVAERVEKLRWRTDGDIERGEGTYVVNTRERDSRLTVLVVEDRAIVVAHRVWVEDSGPTASIDLVRRVVASVHR